MKKYLLTAIACICMASLAEATETKNDNTGNTPATVTASTNNNVSDIGPTVAQGIIAENLGNETIRIDVYYASNMCNAYVAYLSGQNTNSMAVFTNSEYVERQRTNNIRIKCQYYVTYRGSRYYFNM